MKTRQPAKTGTLGPKDQGRGKNKMRGVVLRSGGYYYLRQVDGVRHATSLKTWDEGEAIDRALEIRKRGEIAAGGSLIQDIEAYVSFKVREGDFTRMTAIPAGYVLKRFAGTLSHDTTVDQVTAAHVEKWRTRLLVGDEEHRGIKEGTARDYLLRLRSFFGWAQEVGRRRVDNPVPDLPRKRKKRLARIVWVSREIKDRLILNAPNPDIEFILQCGFHAGMRKNEIIQARVRWFDLGAKTIEIVATPTFLPKDKEARRIPMHPSLSKFLESYLAGKKPNDFAMRPDKLGGSKKDAKAAIYRYDPRKPFFAYLESQGLRTGAAGQREAWHAMRHTFCTLAIQSGKVTIDQLRLWTGDGLEVLQAHYIHHTPGHQDAMAAI